MRFSLFAVSALTAAEAFAPTMNKPSQIIPPMMAQSRNEQHWWQPMAASIAALTLAGQVAVASVTMDVPAPSAFDSSTQTLGAQIETLDFSLPSYDGSTSSGKSAAPSFKPFADFDYNAKPSESASTQSAPAPAPAPDTSKEEEKARKAEAEKKKAEEKAAKDAEKEARKREQLEKQKAASQKARAEEASTPSLPDLSDIKVPEFKAPDIKVPDFKAPDLDIKIPEFKEFKAPDVDFKKPDVKVPDFKKPDIKLPDFKKPDFDFKKPDIKIPDIKTPNFNSEYNLDIPKFDTSKIDTSKVKLPNIGGPPPDLSKLASQDVRDERARDARSDFVAADNEAKEAEAAARAVRQVANDKLKAAREAKDEACQTRPGGKLICLRNPFSTGY